MGAANCLCTGKALGGSAARNLRFEVVAKGVERAEQLAFLAVAGCEIVQGYYFAAPQPAANIPAYAASLMSELQSGSS
ncbi:EAL domain-containing protein (putative c-di-GMP-specific phosphodiesterase class I) [Paraburkholderia sp. RAU6.4a]|uniref:EAL domain-containing protein n=1 Tax=Paraburkholderia sp. RAU6.4a TaxID=2991067 RepID=UPI003D238E01